jgi:hypothetical protein
MKPQYRDPPECYVARELPDCKELTNNARVHGMLVRRPGTPSGGACQPRGGQVQGGISSQEQVTFRCT